MELTHLYKVEMFPLNDSLSKGLFLCVCVCVCDGMVARETLITSLVVFLCVLLLLNGWPRLEKGWGAQGLCFLKCVINSLLLWAYCRGV